MGITNEKIIEQLLEFYYDEKAEFWHKERMGRIAAWDYHAKLIASGNIITVSTDDVLCGYAEYWRLSYEQFGRIICGESFSGVHEDVSTGQIAYLANVYIRPEFRRTTTAVQLRDRFMEINQECTHFCGTARRKSSQPVKVFKREEILNGLRKDNKNGCI